MKKYLILLLFYIIFPVYCEALQENISNDLVHTSHIEQTTSDTNATSTMSMPNSLQNYNQADNNTMKLNTHKEFDISDILETFSLAFNITSILLIIITLLLTVTIYIVIKMVVIAGKEQKTINDEIKNISTQKREFEEYIKDLKDSFKHDQEKFINTFRRTIFIEKEFIEAKQNVAKLLSATPLDKNAIYTAIQKTINSPDLECIHLYSISIGKFPQDIDIMRLVRNGLLSFSKNPNLWNK